jgi:hypothetical protein
VWGADDRDNTVWGTDGRDNIVWGTAVRDTVRDNIVWGTVRDGKSFGRWPTAPCRLYRGGNCFV